MGESQQRPLEPRATSALKGMDKDDDDEAKYIERKRKFCTNVIFG